MHKSLNFPPLKTFSIIAKDRISKSATTFGHEMPAMQQRLHYRSELLALTLTLRHSNHVRRKTLTLLNDCSRLLSNLFTFSPSKVSLTLFPLLSLDCLQFSRFSMDSSDASICFSVPCTHAKQMIKQ